MKVTDYLNYFCLGLIALTVVGCSSDDVSYNIPEEDTKIPDDKIGALIPPSTFYIVNEGWLGPDMGSINGIDYNDNVSYRLFQSVNPDFELGLTTQFATAYGEHYFAVSKQKNRLVMMDKNFKQQATLTEIGGDGRAFVGINKNKAYVSTSKGVSVISIQDNNLTFEKLITGYSKQVGSLVYRNNYVYAATSSDGLLIIDTNTDEIVKTSAEKTNQLTMDRLGNVWFGFGNKLTKIDTSLPIDQQIAKATTFDVSPSTISSSAGAWNAGSLCASAKKDVLYWTSGQNVVEYNIESNTVNPTFYTLDTDADNVKLEFYGAGLRVDPVMDDLVLTVKRASWGPNGSYNWAKLISNIGALKKEIFIGGGTINELGGYYWFPAIPMFQDNNAPQIIANQIATTVGTTKVINLDDIVYDQDNPQKLIEVSVDQVDATFGEIIIEKGKLNITAFKVNTQTTFKMTANSNGKFTTKTVKVTVK